MSLINLFKNVTKETIQSINNINGVVKRMDDKVDEYCENVAKDLSKIFEVDVEVVKIKGILTKNLIVFHDEEMRKKIEEKEERIRQKELELKEKEEMRKRKIEEKRERDALKEKERKEREERKQKERLEKEARRQKERELREEKIRQRDKEREERDERKQKEREEKEAKKRKELEYKNQKNKISSNRAIVPQKENKVDNLTLNELIKEEPISIRDDFWTFSIGKIKDETIYLHKQTNIVCLKKGDNFVFKGIRVDNKLVKDKDVVDEIKYWLKDCGIIVESLIIESESECSSISYSESETTEEETTEEDTTESECEKSESECETDYLYNTE